MPKLLPTRVDVANRKVKVAIYGPSGIGKSHAGLTFPKPLVLNIEGAVDSLCDRPEFAETLKIDIDPSATPHENLKGICDVVKSVYARNPDYPCETLVMDSITGLQKLLKSGLESRPKNVGEWGNFNWEAQRAIDSLYGPAPCHVVAIAQEKAEFVTQPGGRGPEPTGRVIPDADKRMIYAFDLLVRGYFDYNGDRKRRMYVVEKSRLLNLPEGTVIEDFSFAKNVLPALKGGDKEPEIPAHLSTSALTALWKQVGSPMGSIKAWLGSKNFSTSPTLDERIQIEHALKEILHANTEPENEMDDELIGTF